MRKNNNNLIVLAVLGVGVAFFLGYQTKNKEKEINEKAGEIAVNTASKHVKTQSQITKDWFNTIINQWKQIW